MPMISKADTTKIKSLKLTPLPLIYYSPETRLGFGAIVAANFKTGKRKDTLTKGSYAQIYAMYTLNKQYDIGNQFRMYTPNNRCIISSKFNYRYFPEFYFGIETGKPLLHKDTIRYNNFTEDFKIYKRFGKICYWGLETRYNHIANINSGAGHFATEQPLGYDGYSVIGFGPVLCIETRDNFVYPRKGFFMEYAFLKYSGIKKSGYPFAQLKLDIRKYFPIHITSNSDVIALQMLINCNKGEVPFKDMADIGGAYTMRGYYTGFYRFKNIVASQIESRIGVYKNWGLNLWIGGALTPYKWFDLNLKDVKLNAGIGLRFTINKKDHLNLRLDQGFGKYQQKGFYLDIAEAY